MKRDDTLVLGCFIILLAALVFGQFAQWAFHEEVLAKLQRLEAHPCGVPEAE